MLPLATFGANFSATDWALVVASVFAGLGYLLKVWRGDQTATLGGSLAEVKESINEAKGMAVAATVAASTATAVATGAKATAEGNVQRLNAQHDRIETQQETLNTVLMASPPIVTAAVPQKN